jgi:hypothetical protein
MADPVTAPEPRSAAWLAPYVAVLTLATVLGLFASLWPSAIAVGAVIGAGWLVLAVWRLGAAVLRRDHVRLLRALALVVVIAMSPFVFRNATLAGWIGRLWLYQPAYDAAVAAGAPDPAGRLVLFHWGHYLIYDEVSLAYDERDQLRRPQDGEPAAFRARLASAIDAEMRRRRNVPKFAEPRWEAIPLWRHYYVVRAHG